MFMQCYDYNFSLLKGSKEKKKTTNRHKQTINGLIKLLIRTTRLS